MHASFRLCLVLEIKLLDACFIFASVCILQVTKQGVSDRVVDELNPGQQFTKDQVEVLISYDDRDMPSLSEEDVEKCANLTSNDSVLNATLSCHAKWITTVGLSHSPCLKIVFLPYFLPKRVPSTTSGSEFEAEQFAFPNVKSSV